MVSEAIFLQKENLKAGHVISVRIIIVEVLIICSVLPRNALKHRHEAQLIELPPTCTELRGNQQRAIQLLIAGKSVTETAIAVGVDRRTLQRWRSNNPHFQAEYNRQRTEIYESAQFRFESRRSGAQSVDQNNHPLPTTRSAACPQWLAFAENRPL